MSRKNPSLTKSSRFEKVGFDFSNFVQFDSYIYIYYYYSNNSIMLPMLFQGNRSDDVSRYIIICNIFMQLYSMLSKYDYLKIVYSTPVHLWLEAHSFKSFGVFVKGLRLIFICYIVHQWVNDDLKCKHD